MTTITAPLTNIALQGLVPDVVRSCIVQQPSPPPDPGETPPGPITGDGIYTPVAPGVTYGSLPTVSIVDTSPDQMIGCIIDTADNPQGRLNALFPSAVDGDGVIERSTNDIWVFDGATWNNVGPTPGPTIVTATVIPPWNEIVVYDARVRTRLEVNGLAYALALLTEPAAYGITLDMTVRSVTALVAVPTANVTLSTGLPAVIAENPILVPAVNLTATANAPAISSGASVEVPSTSITLNGIIPAQVGTLDVIIAVPSQTISADLHAPQVSTGSSVSVPVSNANLTAYAPTVFDDDAWTYILAVESADTEALEDGVRIAINTFVVGCKSDGIWNAIKSSCILAGARTLTGALVPLKGTAPTSFNFVSADYSRTTGLIGNASTKYLDSNRPNNADPQNSFHLSVWASTAATSAINEFPAYIGYDALGLSKTGLSHIGRLDNNSTSLYVRARMSAPAGEFDAVTNQGSATGFIALNRASSTTYTARAGGVNTVFTRTSATAQSGNIGVFYAQNVSTHSNARIAFYSIGESLDLALLDSRVTQLIADIDAVV